MAVTLEEFIKDFTPEERAKLAARTAEPMAEATGEVDPRRRDRSAKEPAQNGG
jgi:hypothetical protein